MIKTCIECNKEFETKSYNTLKCQDCKNKKKICPVCGKEHNKSGQTCSRSCSVKLGNLTKAKNGYCSPFSRKEVREKSKQTMINRYGVDNVFKLKEVQERARQNKDYDKIKESIKASVQNKYGVDNVFQLESTKQKIKETDLEKYGTEHHMQNEEIKSKMRNTYSEKHNGFFLQSEEIKEKSNKTINNKYRS